MVGGVAPLTSPPALLASPRGGGDKLSARAALLSCGTAVACPTCGTAVEDPAAGGDGADDTAARGGGTSGGAGKGQGDPDEHAARHDVPARLVRRARENAVLRLLRHRARPKVTTATPIAPALVASRATGCPGRRKAAALRLRYPRTSLAPTVHALRLAPRTGIFIDLDDDYCPLDERRPEDGPKVHEHCWDDSRQTRPHDAWCSRLSRRCWLRSNDAPRRLQARAWPRGGPDIHVRPARRGTPTRHRETPVQTAPNRTLTRPRNLCLP